MSDDSRIRIVIADDQELVRAGFTMVINSQPDMQVVGQASNGDEAIRLAEQLTPDIVLMDVRMPIMGGYEATRAIRETDRPDHDLPIIAMTADAFAEDVKRALDAGMNAHVAKPIDVGEVMRLLEKFIK